MTFLEMARQRRLRDGFEKLADGGAVIEGQLEAGFDSASAFRAAFAYSQSTAIAFSARPPLSLNDIARANI